MRLGQERKGADTYMYIKTDQGRSSEGKDVQGMGCLVSIFSLSLGLVSEGG